MLRAIRAAGLSGLKYQTKHHEEDGRLVFWPVYDEKDPELIRRIVSAGFVNKTGDLSVHLEKLK